MNAEAIRREARRLGFARCGVARLQGISAGEDLRRWVAEGRHGTMEWMAKDVEARADPGKRIPEARSVISLAMSYAPAAESPGWPGEGLVARYARGADYHGVLGDRLDALSNWIRASHPGATARWWADTGPIMDKAWAARAGVGWIAKNTNAIDTELGSYFFLGDIVTSLELDPDPPALDHCGSCTRCLDACPTRALAAPGRIDARLCIAYLTIEHRGPIDESLREKMGAWIFGCDICQEVCPWNEEAPPATEPAFAARSAPPRLVDWLRMSEDDYRNMTKGSALRRAKRPMLRRNAAIALGNAGDAAARPALEEASRDADPLVAEAAAWALARLEKPPKRIL